jgi:TP901 family phage tail tape measure protein
MALPPILVELKASSGEFMAKMGAARAEVQKLGTDSSAHLQKFAAVGRAAFIGTAAAAVGAGIASVKMAGDFQQSMTQLVTGAGESQRQIKMVGNGILDLSTKVGYNAQELAKGMYLIESAGFHGANGLNVLKAAAEGARAGNAEMATVADALTTAMNAYHLPASRAIAVTNQLIKTEQSGKLTMEQLASSLGSVVPAAATAHISLSEVLGAIATMTNQGTDAANATTYLRQTILQLSNPTAKARTEMQGLGLSSIDISKNLGKRGLTGTLEILTEAIEKKMGPAGTVLIEQLKKASGHTSEFQRILANLPPTQQTFVGALANMVGGTKSMQAALELTGRSAGNFTKNVQGISAAAKGAGKDVTDWDLVQKNFNLQMHNLENTIGKLAIELGTDLIPVIQSAATWMAKHQTAAKVLGVAIAALTGGFIALYVAVKTAGLLLDGAALANRLFGSSAAVATPQIAGEAAAASRLLTLVRGLSLIGTIAIGVEFAYSLNQHGSQKALNATAKDPAGNQAVQFLQSVGTGKNNVPGFVKSYLRQSAGEALAAAMPTQSAASKFAELPGPDVKSGAYRAKVIQQQEATKKHGADVAKAFAAGLVPGMASAGASGGKALAKGIDAATQRLVDSAKDYISKIGAEIGKLAANVKTARDTLKQDLQAKAQFAAGIAGNLGGFATLGNALGDVTQSTTAGATGGPVAFGDAMAQRLQTLQTLNTDVTTLKNQGLNTEMLQQLTAGTADQGVQLAQQILSGQAGSVQQLNTMQQQIDKATQSTAQAVADATYAKQLAADEKRVAEQLKEQKKQTALLEHIAHHLGLDIAHALTSKKGATALRNAMLELRRSSGQSLGFT